MVEFFDTHTHLGDAQFDMDRDEILRLCQERGIRHIVEIADAPKEWEKAVALSRARPAMIRCSLGLHPYYAAEYSELMAELLFRKAKLPEVVAIGEIGLDYVKSPAPADVQKQTFLKMLELAKRCNLPIVIHCRGAYSDMMDILRDFYKDPPQEPSHFHGVLHCFSGGKDEALAAVRLGFALGVDGPITYPKNDDLREAIAAAGLDHVVLETDSPYLPPQSARGKRNDPRSIPEIAERVAQIFNVSLDEIARRTTHNAQKLFRSVNHDSAANLGR